MLIDFSVKNYKSFKDGFDFSMKASRVQDLKYSLLEYKNKKSKIEKILSSSVVYGPNASGKTTFIEAFSCIKNIILNGNVENSKNRDRYSINNDLELVPFIDNEKVEPTEFHINFVHNNNDYDYLLLVSFGEFFSDDERIILKENLNINEKIIFNREINNVEIYYENIDEKFVNEGVKKEVLDANMNAINSNLETTTLFLTTDFRSYVSKEIYNEILEWFNDKLLVFNNFNNLKFFITSDKKEIVELPDEIYEGVSKIGVLATSMFYRRNSNDSPIPTLYSGINVRGKDIRIPSSIIESTGTLRFIDLLPALIYSLSKGVTLIIDEMDASLHPMVVMSVVNLYHNPNINKNKAQLIFNTHNPIFLNNDIFRRDEMCFVEKNRETKISEFYKLSDFGTNSDRATRSTTDYINNYFMNKYGAIEYVDLSELFEDIMNDDMEE